MEIQTDTDTETTHLHVRCTNLLSLTLQQGFTDDSTSPSIKQKSSENVKQFKGACPDSSCPMAQSAFFCLIFIVVLICEDLNIDLSGGKRLFIFYRDRFSGRKYTNATYHGICSSRLQMSGRYIMT